MVSPGSAVAGRVVGGGDSASRLRVRQGRRASVMAMRGREDPLGTLLARAGVISASRLINVRAPVWVGDCAADVVALRPTIVSGSIWRCIVGSCEVGSSITTPMIGAGFSLGGLVGSERSWASVQNLA